MQVRCKSEGKMVEEDLLLYFTSTKHLFVILTSGAGGSLDIPTLGIKHSQPGNIIFPLWEYLASYGITY